MEPVIYDKNFELGSYCWNSSPNRAAAYKLRCSKCDGDNFIRDRNMITKEPVLVCCRCDKEYKLPEGIGLEIVEASDDMADFAEDVDPEDYTDR